MSVASFRTIALGSFSLVPALQAAPLLPGKKLGLDFGPTVTTGWNNFISTTDATKGDGQVVMLNGGVADGVSIALANIQFCNNDGTNTWLGLQSNPASIAPNPKAPAEFVDSVVTDIMGNFSLGDASPFKVTIEGLNPYLAFKMDAVTAAGQPTSTVARIESILVTGAASYGPTTVPRASAVNSGLFHHVESLVPSSGGQLVIDTIDSSTGTNPILNGVLLEAVSPTAAGLLDDDSDTMPNWWEVAYQFDPASNADGGSTDADGDGFSNVAEFNGGSDPRDNLSVPTPPTWALNGDGSWGTAGNWNPAAVPNGVDKLARLSSAALATAPGATIAMNQPVTLGALEVKGAKPFTLGSGNAVTFSTTAAGARVFTDATAGDSVRFTGNVVLASPLEVTAPGQSAIVISGSLSDNGGALAITKAGSGDLVLAGNTVAYAGDVTINAGRLVLSRSGAYTFPNVIGGSGVLAVTGGGTLSMSLSNMHSGGTQVTSASTLEIDNAAPLGTGAITLDDGTLRATGPISASGKLLNVGALGATVNVTDVAFIATTGSPAASTGDVLKTGPGTWQLVGGNSGTVGTFTIAQGTLDLARNDSFGSHSASQQDLVIGAGAKVTNGTGSIGYNTFRSVALEGGNLAVSNSLSALTGMFQAYGIKQSLVVSGAAPSVITDEVNGANGSINVGGTADLGGGAGSDLLIDVADVTGSNAADLTISAKLKNSATAGYVALRNGLVKDGAGTLVLTRVNSYTGNTTINGGTLSLQQASLEDTADVNIGTGTVLHLDFPGSDTIDQLTLGGEGVAAGVYGAVGSSAPIIGTPYITGSGTLAVTATSIVEDPFADWIATNYPSLVAPDNESSADPDRDGATNLEEFAFAGDPTSGSNQGLRRFSIETVGATHHLTLTVAVRAGAVFEGAGPLTEGIDGIDYTVRGSDDLANFTLGLTEVAPAVVTGLPSSVPSGFEYRTFRITDPVASHPKAFLQISAAAAP